MEQLIKTLDIPEVIDPKTFHFLYSLNQYEFEDPETSETYTIYGGIAVEGLIFRPDRKNQIIVGYSKYYLLEKGFVQLASKYIRFFGGIYINSFNIEFSQFIKRPYVLGKLLHSYAVKHRLLNIFKQMYINQYHDFNLYDEDDEPYSPSTLLSFIAGLRDSQDRINQSINETLYTLSNKIVNNDLL